MLRKKTTGTGKGRMRRMLAITMAVLLTVLLAGCAGSSGNNPEDGGADVQVLAEGEDLVIPLDGITETVSFYPVQVNGMRMEVLAVRDSQGQIRTAFNTCQICYSSGRGYYVQSGNYLVCQNCGNRFTVDHVEVESGGCNPWPIFSTDKTVTEDAVRISYDFLNRSRQIFASWKV